jgi:Txe/YoeB family toxin of Txe-Axe toxin-antitoxin module
MRGDYKKTADLLPVIEKHLHGGKTLKEIAYLLKMEPDAVWKITQRHEALRKVLYETYDKRYPNAHGKPLLKLKAL